MNIIQPKAQYWNQGLDMFAHVMRCARVCYQSTTDSTANAESFCEHLWANGHRSMFRHWSCYYIIRDTTLLDDPSINRMLDEFSVSPYVCFRRKKRKVFMSTNAQFVREHLNAFTLLQPFCVPLKEFVSYAVGDDALLQLVRFTVCCDTSIGISREMNRVSPNAIAEQSTRYVNFGRKGGVQFVEPWYYARKNTLQRFLVRMMWRTEAAFYRLALSPVLSLKPQGARGFLPLDAATRVVYTYSVKEWKHILDLRLRNTTGQTHPDAQLLAALIQQEINNRLRFYSDTAKV